MCVSDVTFSLRIRQTARKVLPRLAYMQPEFHATYFQSLPCIMGLLTGSAVTAGLTFR
jgi:hypothetical protein